MSNGNKGQVSEDAARIYEEIFVPSLFESWAQIVAEAADIRRGHKVLDVACGTGLVAMTIVDRVGADGAVVGVDINNGMLEIARSKSSQVAWQQAAAEQLPFADGGFDRVVCQFSLMYFEDRERALGEMTRVLRPGGLLVFNVWDRLENNPGFLARTVFWQRLVGERANGEAPYSLGDKQVLSALLKAAGISSFEIDTRSGTARYPSIRDWMQVTAKGWTQEGLFDDAQLERMQVAAQGEFAEFEKPDGSVCFPSYAHLVTVTG